MSLPLFGRFAARSLGALAVCQALALGALSPAAFAQDALTLERAQQMAVARSLQLAGQDAAAGAARELAVAAGQLPDPMLRAGVENLPVGGPDRYRLGADSMTMRRIGIEQELPGAAKRAVRAERYQRLAERSAAEKAALAAAIERDTALAWLDLRYATLMTALVAQQAAQAEASAAAAEAAYRGGRGSQAEVLAARGAAALAHDRADQFERQRANAQDMLARWVGSERPQVAGEADIAHLRTSPDALLASVGRLPEVAVLARAEAVARAEVRVAEAERRPDWRVELAWQQRGRDYPNMVSFGLAVPLQWDRAKRQDREVAARLALAEQARDEREEAERARAVQARALVGEWQTGLQRLARYRTEIVPLAGARAEAAGAAYRGGKATLAEVLAARSAETEARLQSLQLEADTARTWARLNFLFPTNEHDVAPTAREEQQ